MYVAAADRVADAIEAKPRRVVDRRRLRLVGDERGIVDGAAIARPGLQREVEIGNRQRAMLAHDLVDPTLLLSERVLVAQQGHQLVAVAPDGPQAQIARDPDTALVE